MKKLLLACVVAAGVLCLEALVRFSVVRAEDLAACKAEKDDIAQQLSICSLQNSVCHQSCESAINALKAQMVNKMPQPNPAPSATGLQELMTSIDELDNELKKRNVY